MSKRIGIITLGCKVNQYESEAFSEELIRRGYEVCDEATDCDAYIINTCTVTAEADRKSRQMIRRAARSREGVAVVVTGCTAEYSAEELSSIEGVIAVCGNGEKMKCVDILDDYFNSQTSEYPIVHMPSVWEAEFEKMQLNAFPRTRVYIKIEDGCENKCAYCAIPRARGNVRSKAPEDVLREVKGFIDEGCPEVVLTGIETASYGKDLEGVKLGLLLRLVDAIAGNCRIRLGSLDPSLFKESFVSEIKGLSSLAPHFHISLQSGSSSVLALMKRKYNADMARDAIQRIREAIPGVMFTTDVIVGFPGETEDDFLDTAEFLRDARFLSTHIFPYSEREGTLAAEMPNKVPVSVRKERAARLTEFQKQIKAQLLTEEIERLPERKVLFETYSDGKAHGHTDSFIEVCVESPCDLRGHTLTVTLTAHDGDVCFGEIKDTKSLAALLPGEGYIPKRKSGVVKGFNAADDDYLMRINRDLGLRAELEELKFIRQNLCPKSKDPSVAELYFAVDLMRDILKHASLYKRVSTVSGADKDAQKLLASLARRYSTVSDDADNPEVTTLAEFAASGRKIPQRNGIFITKKDAREFPPPHSGNMETVIAGDYAFTLSTGVPLGSLDKQEICAVLSPPRGMNTDEFFEIANKICAKFSKTHPDASFVPATKNGFLRDLFEITDAALIDVTLLPTPAAFAEAVLLPLDSSVMVLTQKRHLSELWKIAGEYAITPCAPAVFSGKGFTVKAPEGNIVIGNLGKLFALGDFGVPYRIEESSDTSAIDSTESISYDFSISDCSLTVRASDNNTIYEKLCDLMSDKSAVYAVCGTVNVYDGATIPMILALDAFRRNEKPRVLYSRFFSGEKASICIFKLTEKKI